MLFLGIFHLTQLRICLVQAEVGMMPMAYFQGIHVQKPLQIIWIKFKNKLKKGGLLEILSIKTENQRSSMRKWFLKDHLQSYDTFFSLS